MLPPARSAGVTGGCSVGDDEVEGIRRCLFVGEGTAAEAGLE